MGSSFGAQCWCTCCVSFTHLRPVEFCNKNHIVIYAVHINNGFVSVGGMWIVVFTMLPITSPTNIEVLPSVQEMWHLIWNH